MRAAVGCAIGVVAPVLAGVALYGHTGLLEAAAVALLALTVAVALLAGTLPALVAAVMSGLVLNWSFTRPVGTLRIKDGSDVVVVAVFLVCAVAVSTVVDRLVRRAVAAAAPRSAGESAAAVTGEPLAAGDLVIDFDRHRVTRRGTEVALTPTEWSFLEVLARSPGRLVPRERILKEVWGPAYGRETNYLRVYMSQLRSKLEDDPSRPRHLITTSGVGYTFEP